MLVVGEVLVHLHEVPMSNLLNAQIGPYDEPATLPGVSLSQSARIIAQPHFYIVLQFVSFPEDFSGLKLSQRLD